MSINTILLFGMVITATHFIAAVTGFGCNILSLPFCTMFVGIKKGCTSSCNAFLDYCTIYNSIGF